MEVFDGLLVESQCFGVVMLLVLLNGPCGCADGLQMSGEQTKEVYVDQIDRRFHTAHDVKHNTNHFFTTTAQVQENCEHVERSPEERRVHKDAKRTERMFTNGKTPA